MIERRKVEKIVYVDEIVGVTCSRCGTELKSLVEEAYKASPEFPFAGVYIRGAALLPMLAMPLSWELCNTCTLELSEWIGHDEKPEDVRAAEGLRARTEEPRA